MAEIIESLTSNYLFWVLLISVVAYFLYDLYLRNRKNPEEEAFYGAKMREEFTRKKIEKRNNVWAIPIKYQLMRGLNYVGEVKSWQTLYRFNRKDTEKIEEFYEIVFIKTDWLSQAKFYLLGWGKEYLMLDPKVLRIDHKKKQVIIDPLAFLIDDSGIWTMATEKETKLVDDFTTKLHLEDLIGRLQDVPRKVSNMNPATAVMGEMKELDAKLKEQERRNRIGTWTGK